MAWMNRAKAAASFSNREQAVGFATVGELGLDNALFDGLSFDDEVPGAGKTLGELTFEDLIRISIWAGREPSAASFANRQKSA